MTDENDPNNKHEISQTIPRHHQAQYFEPLIFELGVESRVCIGIPDIDLDVKIDIDDLIPLNLRRDEPPELPELSEPELARHYTRLSQMSYGVDTGIYPLGSCTMKYNPKLSESIARWPKFTDLHPYQDESTVQGSLQIMYELQQLLAEIAGVDTVTLQPAAGAAGEFTGLLLTRAYHEFKNETAVRTEVILPDTAHGTNPASAVMAGYDVVEIPSNSDGCVNLEALESALSEKTAAFMLTNPNTLGIFEHDVLEIAKLVHQAGALLYYDGANLNAILGKARPGDMGYDIVHFNLHKTFGTPHGGGGPGSGPIGVKTELAKFLPVPLVGLKTENDNYFLDYDIPNSIGKVKGFYGNFNVLLKAYVYIKLFGSDGLKEAAEIAVLNSNYLKDKLKKYYPLPHKDLRKHEFVLSGSKMKEDKNVRTLDIAKRLMDHGLHAPTIYFPLLVDEALMIEPTESEPKEELDRFIEAMIKIVDEDPELAHSAPHYAAVSRIDEVYAAKNLILSYRMMKETP